MMLDFWTGLTIYGYIKFGWASMKSCEWEHISKKIKVSMMAELFLNFFELIESIAISIIMNII